MRHQARRILPFAEREQLRNRVYNPALNESPADLASPDQWVHAPGGRVNEAEAKAKDARMKAILDAGSPHDESPSYKRWRDRRILELEDRLRKDVVPLNVFHMKRQDSSAYRDVVSTLRSQIQNPDRVSMEQELQSLRREREPENPSAGKLSDLREERKIAVGGF